MNNRVIRDNTTLQYKLKWYLLSPDDRLEIGQDVLRWNSASEETTSFILVISRDHDGYHISLRYIHFLHFNANGKQNHSDLISEMSLKVYSIPRVGDERYLQNHSTLKSADWMMAGNRIQYNTLRRHFNVQQGQSNIVWSVFELSTEQCSTSKHSLFTQEQSYQSFFHHKFQQIILFT